MTRWLKTTFRALFKGTITRVSVLVSLPFLILSWIIPFWRLSTLGDHIPLHYNVYFGVDYIGRWEMVILLPVFATISLVVNLVVAKAVRKESEPLANALTLSAAGVSTIVFAAMFFILVLNS